MLAVAAAVLTFEAIVIMLAIPVAVAVADVDASVAVPAGLGLGLLALVAAAGLRRGWGVPLGWAVQVGAVALGFVVPTMFFLGGVFALLWFLTFRLGRQIEQGPSSQRGPAAD